MLIISICLPCIPQMCWLQEREMFQFEWSTLYSVKYTRKSIRWIDFFVWDHTDRCPNIQNLFELIEKASFSASDQITILNLTNRFSGITVEKLWKYFNWTFIVHVGYSSKTIKIFKILLHVPNVIQSTYLIFRNYSYNTESKNWNFLPFLCRRKYSIQ